MSALICQPNLLIAGGLKVTEWYNPTAAAVSLYNSGGSATTNWSNAANATGASDAASASANGGGGSDRSGTLRLSGFTGLASELNVSSDIIGVEWRANLLLNANLRSFLAATSGSSATKLSNAQTPALISGTEYGMGGPSSLSGGVAATIKAAILAGTLAVDYEGTGTGFFNNSLESMRLRVYHK